MTEGDGRNLSPCVSRTRGNLRFRIPSMLCGMLATCICYTCYIPGSLSGMLPGVCDVVMQPAAAGADDEVGTRRSSVWQRLSKVTRRAPTTTATDKTAQSSSTSRAPGNGSVPRQAPVRVTMNHCSPSSPLATTVVHGRMRPVLPY